MVSTVLTAIPGKTRFCLTREVPFCAILALAPATCRVATERVHADIGYCPIPGTDLVGLMGNAAAAWQLMFCATDALELVLVDAVPGTAKANARDATFPTLLAFAFTCELVSRVAVA